MDNKRTLIAMILVIVLVLGYRVFLVEFIYPKHPEWFKNEVAAQPAATERDVAATQMTTMPTAAIPSSEVARSNPTTLPTAAPRIAASQPIGHSIDIGSGLPNDKDYTLGLSLSARSGIESATINQAKAADSNHPYTFQHAYGGDESLQPLGDRYLVVNGQNLDLNVPWNLESSSASESTFGVDVLSGSGSGILHVTKTVQVGHRDKNDASGGYEVSITYHLKNSSASEQSVRFSFNGPTMPPRELERGDDRQSVFGYDKGDKSVDVVRKGLSEFKPGADDLDVILSDKQRKLLWAGDSSSYFSAIVRPESMDQFSAVHVRALNSDAPAENRLVVMQFDTANFVLPPGASLDVPIKVFLGPKERQLLEGDYYGYFPREYSQLLSVSSSFCGICAVPKLVDFLVFLLAMFHYVLRDWGLAIITLVVIVRLLLHPITKGSQVSMMKMQKMGPELERLKKKFGDDKEAFSKAQMEFYKEMGISPFLGCLPMFLQMPIWIALYSALQSEYRLRQASFLGPLTWIRDLSRPDRFITWDSHPFTLPLLGTITALNVLPLLIAVVMYVQQKMQPQAPTMTAEQESQRKMMMWMSFLWPFFLYTAPSGLNLYIMTSTTIGIIESKRIRDHIKQRQEAEKAGPIIIDAPVGGIEKKRMKGDDKDRNAPATGGFAGLWNNLQRRLEDLNQEADKRKGKRR